MKNLFKTHYFNVLLALIVTYLTIMQEHWIGTPFNFINYFGIGALVGIGISWCTEVIKVVFVDTKFSIKDTLIGGIAAIVMALILTLILM